MSTRAALGIAIIMFVTALFLAPRLATTTISPLVDYYLDATPVAQRTGLDLAQGNGIALTASDDPANNRVSYTVSSSDTSGTATITAGATSTSVTHGLGATSTRVYLSPTSDTQGARWWASDKGTTTFAIILNATTTQDVTFDWRARE